MNYFGETSRSPEPGGGPKSGFALYVIEGSRITCRLCGHTSTEPKHVQDRYCPNCRVFLEDRSYMLRLDAAARVRFEPEDEDWRKLKAA